MARFYNVDNNANAANIPVYPPVWMWEKNTSGVVM